MTITPLAMFVMGLMLLYPINYVLFLVVDRVCTQVTSV